MTDTMQQLQHTLVRDGGKLARYTQQIEEAEREVESLKFQRANLISSLEETTAKIEALENKERVETLEMENKVLRREVESLRSGNIL